MIGLIIRASIGTAAVLGLEKIKLQAVPTTAYLMMYTDEPCLSNCSFCPQAKESTSKSNKLSRILWPKYQLDEVLSALKLTGGSIKRLCLQTIRTTNANEELIKILEEVAKKSLDIPISICCYPTTKIILQKMKDLGVKRIGISFDCATPELFNKIKTSSKSNDISWKLLEQTITDAKAIFGNHFVSTHLIIGLGETEKEAVEFIQKFHDQDITIGLFAFTPVIGTAMEKCNPPPMDNYRRVQLARELIIRKITTIDNMTFNNDNKISDFGVNKKILRELINSGKPFRTSGCPNCNRPFYNESPGKELYNFPWNPTEGEIEKLFQYFKEFL